MLINHSCESWILSWMQLHEKDHQIVVQTYTKTISKRWSALPIMPNMAKIDSSFSSFLFLNIFCYSDDRSTHFPRTSLGLEKKENCETNLWERYFWTCREILNKFTVFVFSTHFCFSLLTWWKMIENELF